MSASVLFAAAPVRRVTCLGFDWRAEVSLRETLSLLRGRTREAWQYTDEPTADLVLYDPGNALAVALARRGAAPGRARQCFLSSQSDDPAVPSLRPPFGASRLIQCLDAASRELAGQPAATADALSLAQHLDELIRTPGVQSVILEADGRRGLLRFAGRRLHWPVPLALEDLAALLGAEVRPQPLMAADAALAYEVEAAAPWIGAAEPLLWAIGLTRSGNRLLPRLDASQAYRLRRWPDFGVIGRRSQDLRCTALLTQRALSPQQLAEVAGLPLSVITGYLNAAALCELLQPAGAPKATTVPAAVGEGSLGGMLRRIRLALALG